MDRFEWLLSAQVTMGAGVAPVSSDVPYLGSLSLSPGVQTCHRAVAGTEREQEPLNLDPFTSHSVLLPGTALQF